MPGAEPVELTSTRTLLDFSGVLIDPQGLQNIDKPHFLRRKDDLAEFLARGGSVVWFVRAGWSPRVLLPIEATAEPYSGTKVDIIGSAPFQDFWTTAQTLMQYEATIRGSAGTPALVVSKTDKVVASWQRTGKGLIILLPAPKHHGNPQHREAIKASIMVAVRPLVEALQPGDLTIELPSWAAMYHWPTELELARQKAELEAMAAETTKKIDTVTTHLDAEQRLKILLTGKGDPLVEVVSNAFQILGVNVERGEPGRDDLILSWDGQFAVVEVKGKKGSAAEKDAAQLEKWVAGFKEVHEADAKGILVVNAFCEKSLRDRVDPAFPEQMLKYCKQREHCLMTSTQLLCMALSCRADDAKKASYLKSIFETVGVFGEFANYNTFLTENTNQAA